MPVSALVVAKVGNSCFRKWKGRIFHTLRQITISYVLWWKIVAWDIKKLPTVFLRLSYMSLNMCAIIYAICSVMMDKINDISRVRRTKHLTEEHTADILGLQLFSYLYEESCQRKGKHCNRGESVFCNRSSLHKFSSNYILKRLTCLSSEEEHRTHRSSKSTAVISDLTSPSETWGRKGWQGPKFPSRFQKHCSVEALKTQEGKPPVLFPKWFCGITRLLIQQNL